MTAQYTTLSGDRAPWEGLRNRRACVRFQCAPAQTGKVRVGKHEDSVNGWLVDLSRLGAGLQLKQALAAGHEVCVVLSSGDGLRKLEIPARVAHATQMPNEFWLVGCAFQEPLSYEALESLL